MNQHKDLKSGNPKKRLEAIESIEKEQDVKQIAVLKDFILKEKVSQLRERAEQAIQSLEALAGLEENSPEATEAESSGDTKIQYSNIRRPREFRRVWEAFLVLLLINSFLLLMCYGIYYNKINYQVSWQDNNAEIAGLPTLVSFPTQEAIVVSVPTIIPTVTAALPTRTPRPTNTSTPTEDPVNCVSNGEEAVSMLDYLDYAAHPAWEGNVFQIGPSVEIPFHRDFNVGTVDFSFTIHFRFDRIDNNVTTIFDRRMLARHGIKGISLYTQDRLLVFQMAGGPNPLGIFMSPVAINDSEWHTVSITVERNNTEGGRFYFDGNLNMSFNPTNHQESIDAQSPLLLGQNRLTNESEFDGDIALLEFFPCIILSSEQVLNQAAEAQAATTDN